MPKRLEVELLRRELDDRLDSAQKELADLSHRNEERMRDEVRLARARLKAAEKSSIEQPLHDGLILPQTASKMIEDLDRSLLELTESAAE